MIETTTRPDGRPGRGPDRAGEAARLRVLVIEDDAEARANLRDILGLDGHRVETAATAGEALGRGDWPGFDVIVLDRRLPDADGVDLLPRLLRLAPRAAVVVVTGHPDVRGAVAALRSGAADYIPKPIDAGELRARLGELSQLARARAQVRTLGALLAESPSPVLRVGRDGTVRYANAAAGPLLACWGGGVGRPLPEPWRGAARAAADAAAPREAEAEAGGRAYSLLFAPAPGKKGHVNVYGHDVTALKQAQARAVQAERLAAIGQMMTALAHESRNALNTIALGVDVLRARLKDQPELLDIAERARRALGNLRHLFDDLRDYAAPAALRRETRDLAEVWREAWESLAGAREGRAAALREEAAGVDRRAEVDAPRLEQVFRNLFENSLAACPDPAVIEVRCAAAETGGRPAVRVAVRDNGPGLSPEVRQHIFEPFFTTKGNGTGLGMAIAKRVVEAHGGTITLGDGPGAEVILTLPRRPG
ncbi:MAG TPA: ATP-binding protein [Gemmataceae bacterium]